MKRTELHEAQRLARETEAELEEMIGTAIERNLDISVFQQEHEAQEVEQIAAMRKAAEGFMATNF